MYEEGSPEDDGSNYDVYLIPRGRCGLRSFGCYSVKSEDRYSHVNSKI